MTRAAGRLLDTRAEAPPCSNGVIVIGSHRSGTTLLARMLGDLGVHMGADCDALGESIFFRAVNVRLLRKVGASWHRPDPMQTALTDIRQVTRLSGMLKRALGSPSRYRYLGEGARREKLHIGSSPNLWSWKDPRTTLTLPLWLREFPGARVIHLVRNGIDVARSLLFRQRTAPRVRWEVFQYLARRAWPRRWPDAEREARPFRGLEEAFSLWSDYVRFGLEATATLDRERLLVLRYEDVLADPAYAVRRIASYLGLPVDPTRMAHWVASVDPSGRFRFSREDSADRLLAAFEHNDMLRRFGYSLVSGRNATSGELTGV